VRGHVDSETLAACREGLLSRRKARQVAAHLAHCAQCAGLDAQLAELPALLARSPAPPMPAALTARIEAAIAAEAAARSKITDAASAAARVTRDATGATRDATGVTRDAAAATRRHRKPRAPSPGRSRVVLRIAAAAAAVAVIAGGGYGLLRLIPGSTTSSSGTSAAAPAPAQGAAGSGARKAVPGGAHAAMSPLTGPAGLRIVVSGTNYQPAQLKAQVRATLARFPLKAAGLANGTPGVTPGPWAAFFNLRACLPRVAGGRYVRLVDLAHYEGKPAAIIVIPGPGANEETVRVVAPGCSATANDQIFSTLLPTGG
jgi:hypothetical protein